MVGAQKYNTISSYCCYQTDLNKNLLMMHSKEWNCGRIQKHVAFKWLLSAERLLRAAKRKSSQFRYLWHWHELPQISRLIEAFLRAQTNDSLLYPEGNGDKTDLGKPSLIQIRVIFTNLLTDITKIFTP